MRAPVKTILSVLLTAGGLLPAQEPPPTFTSDTQVVLLDLVARDRKGKTVADLRADEVQVFEDGTRCEIASFRLVHAPGRAEAAAAAPLEVASAQSVILMIIVIALTAIQFRYIERKVQY